MKTRLLAVAAVLLVYCSSCSDVEGSKIAIAENKALPLRKEKKPVKIPKTKKKEAVKVAEIKPVKKEIPEVKETPAAKPVSNAAVDMRTLNFFAGEAGKFAANNAYSSKYCFLIDMNVPSGRNRFIVYDMERKSIALTGLVAHGCCNETYISRPKFSNMSNSGCSSLGKYRVGEFYRGKYGKSFRLYGLDNSNSNAFKRGVVIHAYNCVPDKEIYPMVLCNSLGCPMVSFNFFEKLSSIIKSSDKPILLWIYQ